MGTLLRSLIKLEGLFSKKAFDALTKDPYSIQRSYLLKLLNRNRSTEYGQRYNFANIRSEKDFQYYVPINQYQDLEPYIVKIVDGQENILTSDKVIMFNLTSGTSDKPKFIPVSDVSMKSASALMRHWMYRTLLDHPAFLDKFLFLISGSSKEGDTPSKIPYGSFSGLIYNNLPRRTLSSYVLPSIVSDIRNYDLRYFVMARLALGKDISFIATPNPSTLIKIAETGIKYQDEIIRSIHNGCIFNSIDFQISAVDKLTIDQINAALKPDRARAVFLGNVMSKDNRLLPSHSWPHLKVIGCWLGGSIGYHADKLSAYYGNVPKRDLGYLASEGCITLPYEDSAASGILALQNNYYEFIPAESTSDASPEVLLSHELQEGKYYKIILTNENGLYRYDINDIVKVEKFYNATPVLAFVRKTGDILNITGEKIHVNQLLMAMERIKSEFNISIVQFRVAPNIYHVRYDILLGLGQKVPLQKLADSILPAFDSVLQDINIEYALKRKSGRLNPPCLYIMDPLWEDNVKKKSIESGKRDIQYKWNVISHELSETDRKHIFQTIQM